MNLPKLTESIIRAAMTTGGVRDTEAASRQDVARFAAQVIEMLRKSHDATMLAQVSLSEQEWDEATKVAERRDVWYTVIETVADAAVPHWPEWVTRMSIKQAEQLMVEAKSDRYPIAANWLKKAKKAYEQMGQTQQ